jgi:septal ring factor EnvC (AmiA/AmiB activator)
MEATMIRHITLTLISLLATAAFACEKTGATERQPEVQANEQVAQAKNEVTQRMQSAQATDKDIAAARADFEKNREDYRHARAIDLNDLDKRIADLESKEKTPKHGPRQMSGRICR